MFYRLGVLPLELNRLLIIVVVLSMALTPLLNEAGRKAADIINSKFEDSEKTKEQRNFGVNEPVVILGFSQMGQVLANFLSTPLAAGLDGDLAGIPYVAFDLDPMIVKAARKLGFPVLYGDGSRPAVLQTAGITQPKAVMVVYAEKSRSVQAIERLRPAFPSVPIYAKAEDVEHLLKLKQAGATDVILENAETSLQLGAKLLKGLGVMSDDVSFLSQLMRESMEVQAEEALAQKDKKEIEVLKPVQVKLSDSLKVKTRKSHTERNEEDARHPTGQATKEKDISKNPVDSPNKALLVPNRFINPTSDTCSNMDHEQETTPTIKTSENDYKKELNISNDQSLSVSFENSKGHNACDDERGVTLCNLAKDVLNEQDTGEQVIILDENMECIFPVD
eukprot:TRINITY_DN4653_c0_g1_i2.p2 TRINITY_DN4653_c0_g1~~TRINITY_DN4653_c0_g1_i2.p2  ORF type:complete len:392 (+),score=112.08 TRINITY_DN4653_c0_g1_i2:1807-2982(+)